MKEKMKELAKYFLGKEENCVVTVNTSLEYDPLQMFKGGVDFKTAIEHYLKSEYNFDEWYFDDKETYIEFHSDEDICLGDGLIADALKFHTDIEIGFTSVNKILFKDVISFDDFKSCITVCDDSDLKFGGYVIKNEFVNDEDVDEADIDKMDLSYRFSYNINLTKLVKLLDFDNLD